MGIIVKHCELCEKNKNDYIKYFSYLLSDFPDFFDNSIIGYYTISENEERNFCKVHPNEKLLISPLSADEYEIINYISTDLSFIHAMEELKEKDIIEFNMKISQFKTQLSQQESNEIQNDITPKCPTCGSTKLSKITTTKKVAKIAAFGIFGMGDNGKAWKCNNCGSKF